MLRPILPLYRLFRALARVQAERDNESCCCSPRSSNYKTLFKPLFTFLFCVYLYSIYDLRYYDYFYIVTTYISYSIMYIYKYFIQKKYISLVK